MWNQETSGDAEGKEKWLSRGEEGDSGGSGHKPWDGNRKALVRIGGVRSLGLFITKWPTGIFSCVSYSLPGLAAYPIEGGILDIIMFPTVFCVAHCPWTEERGQDV